MSINSHKTLYLNRKDAKEMITQEKLNIYKQFDGDGGDGFVRSGSKEQKIIMAYTDWAAIDDFLHSFYLVQQNLASLDFIERLEIKLKEYCDSEQTIEMLRQLNVK